MPTGCSVGQALFGDETDGPLLDATGIQAVGQSQVGDVTGKATATAEAAMAGEGNNQIDGLVGPGVTEVIEGARAHSIATCTVVTPRAGPGRPVAAAPPDARLGQVLDTSDALGDIRDILTWTSHGLFS
jgi:hypothetical protein